MYFSDEDLRSLQIKEILYMFNAEWLAEKSVARSLFDDDLLACQICGTSVAILHSTHIFPHKRDKEFDALSKTNHALPLGTDEPANGLLGCPNCVSYLQHSPPLLRIQKDGTIQLYGLAKEQNYLNLHGTKVPWAAKIDDIWAGREWPTSALLDAAFALPPLSAAAYKKEKATELYAMSGSDEKVTEGLEWHKQCVVDGTNLQRKKAKYLAPSKAPAVIPTISTISTTTFPTSKKRVREGGGGGGGGGGGKRVVPSVSATTKDEEEKGKEGKSKSKKAKK